MTKDIQVKFTLRQARVIVAILSPYAEKSAVIRDAIKQINKAVEYRKSHPSAYKQRRVESRKHLQWGEDDHGTES